jgi:hypothetical protein
MIFRRKSIIVSLIAIFAFAGLALRYTPVYADDGTQPPSDLSAVVETAPEGTDSGASGGETGSSSPSVNPPAEPPAIEAVKIVSSPDKPADTDPTQEPTDENVLPSEEPVVAGSPTQTTDVTATPVPAVEQPEDQSPVVEATSTPAGKVTPTQQVFNANETLEKVIKPVDESLLAPESKSPETTPNLVVIDGNGTVLPLGSEQANETIALADPYFYIGATKYTFTTSDCGADKGHAACDNPLQAAFNYIAAHNLSPVGGAVYAEAATYKELSIDGSKWANPLYVPVSLSLIGVTNVDKQVGSSVDHIISGTLSVQNIKSFTLQAFSVAGSVSGNLAYFDKNTGTLNFSDVNVKNTDSSGWGLVVDSNNGPINLTSVTASENGGGGGALIKNSSGTVSPITVTNSVFDKNAGDGLVVLSNGPVTLNSVEANTNSGNGAYIAYPVGTTATSTITVKNSVFNGNTLYGLTLVSKSSPISVTNSICDKNSQDGLVVRSNGAVTLDLVEANANTGNGANISNTSSTTAAATNIVKNSVFNENSGYGLVVSSNGLVNLTGIVANANKSATGAGAYITSRGVNINQSTFNDNLGDGLSLDPNTTGGGAAVIQNSQFVNNAVFGAIINQQGDVTIKNVRAADNGIIGVWINTEINSNPYTGNVTVTGSNFTGNVKTGMSTTNPFAGLNIQAKGMVTLTDLQASNNGNPSHMGSGVWIENATGSWPVNVTNSTFTGNFDNGITILSNGVITLKDIISNNNIGLGVLLDNTRDLKNITGINILNSAGVVNNFSNNLYSGLEIYSNGPVVINAVKADNNTDGDGINVNNSTGIGSVTIDGVSGTTANGNFKSGIYVVSKGIITVKNMNANENFEYGYFLNNQNGANTGVSVLVTLPRWYNNLTGNGNIGLHIQSKGAVIVQKTKTNNNGYCGTYIDNSYGTGTVTISDSEFSHNTNPDEHPLGVNGLFVQSKGAIIITNIKATDNGFDNKVDDTKDIPGLGAWLVNDLATIPASITITNGTFDNNFGDGLRIFSKGAVTFATGSANNNYQTAVKIDNHLATLNQNVTITAVNISGGNRYGTSGLIVLSRGNIAISKSDINSFNGEAVNLDNHFGTGSVSIIGELGRSRWFGYNGGNGLTINTTGGVTMNYLSTNDNGGYGIQINTTGNLSTVQLSNIDVSNNTLYGIDVNAVSNITLDNVRVTDNKSYGINLDNSTGTGTVTVKSLAGNEIRNNTGYGLWVISKGNITLTNIEIHDNGSFGAWLDNSMGTNGTVTINSTMYRNWGRNGDYGLQIDSPGAVIVNWVDAYDSGTYGADINNAYASGTLMPAVTITHSWFNNSHGGYESTIHDGYGLNVDSKGNISLTDVDASNNTDYGADLNNLSGTGTITITGPSADDRNSFDNNADYGLNIQTRGAVTVKYLGVNSNAFYGANINNSTSTLPQLVSLTTADLNDNSKYVNDGYGLTILSKGAITLFEVFASSNGEWGTTPVTGNGMHLDNCIRVDGKCTGSGTVTLTSSNAWDNNGYGLDIQSYGQITLSDISAGYNKLYGGKFNNRFVKANINPLLADIPSTAGISLSLPLGYSSEWGSFQDNGEEGFKITSNGDVTVANVRVLRNNPTGDYAAMIDNSTTTNLKTVTIVNSIFNDNSSSNGLIVVSKGAITFTGNQVINNKSSYVSGQSAVILDNHLSTLPQLVTITNSKFNGNTVGSGLVVKTKGNVLLTNLAASDNSEYGVNIDASYGAGTVTLGGTNNIFNNNAVTGLRMTTNGNVTITNITSEYNSGAGLYIDTNSYGHTGTGIVSVTNANLNKNGRVGIYSNANGTIGLTNVTASGNGSVANIDGAYLVTNNKDITVTNSAFNSNVGRGIYSDTGAGKTLKLVNTMYLGNDTDKSGDKNLSYSGLLSIL